MPFALADARSTLLNAHELLHAAGAEIAELRAGGTAFSSLLALYPCDLQAYAPVLARVFSNPEFALDLIERSDELTEVIDDLSSNTLLGDTVADRLYESFWQSGAYQSLVETLASTNQDPDLDSIWRQAARKLLWNLPQYLWSLACWDRMSEDERWLDDAEMAEYALKVNHELLGPLLAMVDAVGVGDAQP